jgi:small-conductance mechanosensitive channel
MAFFMNPETIKVAVAGWQSTFDGWAERLLWRWDELTSVWTLAQLGIIVASFVCATLLSWLIVPPLERRVRQIRRQPRLLRLLAVLLRRIKWMLFALLLVLVASVMVEVTWPSRSYFVRIAANLATAWVLISTISRVIRNRRIANAIAILAWVVAALILTDLLDSVVSTLDAAAVSVGGLRLSALLVLKATILFGALLWAALLLSDLIDQSLARVLGIDEAIAVLIGKIVRAGLLFFVLLASFSAVGIDLTAFAVFSGAVGLGVGFDLQKVASNLISGFIILLDRSIKPGDVISLGSTLGWITALRARYVQVNTRDGVEYLIPNETFITERLANMSHTNRSIRLEIKFGVSYASDPHLVRRLATAVVAELQRVMAYPEPVCHITGFGDSSLGVVLRFWIQDPEKGVTNVRGEAFLGLWDAFKESGIEIPYPHREVLLRSTQTEGLASRETDRGSS